MAMAFHVFMIFLLSGVQYVKSDRDGNAEKMEISIHNHGSMQVNSSSHEEEHNKTAPAATKVADASKASSAMEKEVNQSTMTEQQAAQAEDTLEEADGEESEGSHLGTYGQNESSVGAYGDNVGMLDHTRFFCHNWCLTCKNPPPKGHKRIMLYRAQGFYKKMLIVAVGVGVGVFAMATFGAALAAAIPLGCLSMAAAASLGSMADGCSVLKFNYDGPEKAQVNIAAMLEFEARQDKDDQIKAMQCTGISKPGSNVEKTAIRAFGHKGNSCFRHPWLCGPEGAHSVEVFWYRAEKRCLGKDAAYGREKSK